MTYILKTLQHIPEDQLRSLDYFQNRGDRFISRCFVEDKQANNERAFSDSIKEYHELRGSGLSGIVEDNDVSIKAAFTLFQWLTTNVGSAVLEEALNKTGRKTVRILE